MKRHIRRFCRAEQGNYAMMTALLLPVLLGSVGFAVDIATLSQSRSELQDTLDAALLAASRISDKAETRQSVFDSYFQANIANARDFGSVTSKFDVDRGLNYISTTATATADVSLHFGFLHGANRRVVATASAYESTNKLEVAMVLDNTGSMGADRMASLRKAATALVDILATVKSPQREVKAALVPFVTAVNVKGVGYKSNWIDLHAQATFNGYNFEPENGYRVNHLTLFQRLGQEWKGCVEARPAPYNLNDTAPDPLVPDTLFVPYFAPDEPGAAKTPGNAGDKFNNTYLDDVVTGAPRDQQRSLAKYTAGGTNKINNNAPLTAGPNYACPTPIHPLTDDFVALKAEIAKMVYWNGSGTNVSEGLAWGLRVLSPQEPYTGGAAFNQDGVTKAVVVFTDGENNVFGASNEPINKSDYGAYSFVDQGRMGSTNRGTALTNVNTYTQSLCTSLKTKGVRVFTVLLGADTAANRTLYSKCASSAADYFPTSDVSQLETVFKKIGAAVAGLYITH